MGNCCCIAGHNKKSLNSNLKDRRKNRKYKTGSHPNYGDYYDDLEEDLAGSKFQSEPSLSGSGSKAKLKSKNNKRIGSYIAAQADLANANQSDRQQAALNANLSGLYKSSNGKFVLLSNANANGGVNAAASSSSTPSRRDNSQIINNLSKGMGLFYFYWSGLNQLLVGDFETETRNMRVLKYNLFLFKI